MVEICVDSVEVGELHHDAGWPFESSMSLGCWAFNCLSDPFH